MNSDGAKLPPLPPLPKVIPVAKAFIIIVKPTKSSKTQGLFLKPLNNVFSSMCNTRFLLPAYLEQYFYSRMNLLLKLAAK